MHVRIKGLVDMFPRGSVLIDVGSDHGYLGLELLKLDKAVRVINIDLSKDALKRSLLTYKRFGFDNRASFILNDGFTGLVSFPKYSVVVIAGMGTSQILKILQRLPDRIERMIILSHTPYYQLRKWCAEHSFFIKNEKYIDDNEHVYIALDLVKVKNNLANSLQDHIFGREEFWRNKNSLKLFRKYWYRHSSRILKIPIQFRDAVDVEIIRFLRHERII